ncbi:hypothetical protein EVAR_89959_1 [Eumeta japonica]|uniref:Uncharacterized protein n=1 Tax=Eumeta variegata TaxID=151549 RepID=A0A4C2AAX7_EUMVA|nr:hypothetical protein EVAR_89959_1 [Eumeta japonica]
MSGSNTAVVLRVRGERGVKQNEVRLPKRGKSGRERKLEEGTVNWRRDWSTLGLGGGRNAEQLISGKLRRVAMWTPGYCLSGGLGRCESPAMWSTVWRCRRASRRTRQLCPECSGLCL